MGRSGFSSNEQRKEIQNRYEKSEKGKLARARTNAKSGAKKFIEEFASKEELKELLKKIEEKLKKEQD